MDYIDNDEGIRPGDWAEMDRQRAEADAAQDADESYWDSGRGDDEIQYTEWAEQYER